MDQTISKRDLDPIDFTVSEDADRVAFCG